MARRLPALDTGTNPRHLALDVRERSGLLSIWRVRLAGLSKHETLWLELACAGVVLASFTFMLANLGRVPFWVDEAVAVIPARNIQTYGLPKSSFDLNFMAPQLKDGLWDPSAPLYRYSVAAFTAVFGFSEATTRFWSVLLGLLLLVPCYGVFRQLLGRAPAALAVATLAALPLFAQECREARHFTFVALMMASTFYFLLQAATREDELPRALWPAFLVATVLGHYVGYLALPVVAVTLAVRRSLLLSRRYAWLYAGLALVYAAVMWRWGETLPLFHSIGCHNRVEGCEPSRWFYLAQLLEGWGGIETLRASLRNVVLVQSQVALLATGVAGLCLLAGLRRCVWNVVRDRDRRAGHVLLLCWLLVPLLLLSSRDLKFARYMFYVYPPLCAVIATGAVELASLRPFEGTRRRVLAVLAFLIVFFPQVSFARPLRLNRLVLESRFLANGKRLMSSRVSDNWERISEQTRYLRSNMKPGDVVVSAFDDASLGYYLGQFVYGFLNSERDDRFFVDLLARTARSGNTLFFIDTLPRHNDCHTPGRSPLNIDCRKKYARFYAACAGPEPDPACRRLKY
jgi:4-amino-4-deoxy-L-arabinose transferase-like glycosyltransferase